MKNSIAIGYEVEILAVNDFQSLKYNVGDTFTVKAVGDVGSDNALYISEDFKTWFHPIDLKVVNTKTDHIWDEYKQGLVGMTEQMQKDRAFIVAAVSLDLIDHINSKHPNFMDNYGFQSYYDCVVAIVDEMLFTEGSLYLNYINRDNKELTFHDFTNDCFDWYYMKQAKKHFTKELVHKVCFGTDREPYEI